ncbi:hypothetical protein AAG570_001593 [Ranatra chinensis]|uniref:Uncharacterized protein n=1 Tax=Ranatra chinensis TaxID=642074 RepID=A0ABD0YL03_9HEMI
MFKPGRFQFIPFSQFQIQRRVKRDANGTEVIEDLTGQERVVQNGTEYAYNYDQFYKEFIKDEEESQRVANEMQQRPEQAEAEGLFKSLNWYLDKLGIHSRRIQMVNCTEQDRASVGLRGFDCIMADYRTNRTSLGNIIGRIVHISIVWSLILCAAITVLWMWLGVGWNWCCCLCFPCCKRLDPEANMKELKAYLVNNPPGIIHENGTEIQYDPSVREVEAFELVRFKLFTFK